MVQSTLPTARACIIENTGRTFKTGRPVVEAVFFDGNRREVCRRSGMRLTSKRGNEYVMCLRHISRREPEQQVPRTASADAQHAVGELFDNL